MAWMWVMIVVGMINTWIIWDPMMLVIIVLMVIPIIIIAMMVPVKRVMMMVDTIPMMSLLGSSS